MVNSYRGYCTCCAKFEVKQSENLELLENACEKSDGKLKVRCPFWLKPDANNNIVDWQDESNH
jgi:hypothetical protein